jgi:hypothetical protein
MFGLKGLDLVAQIIFGSEIVPGLVQMIAIKRYIKHFGLSLATFFKE